MGHMVGRVLMESEFHEIGHQKVGDGCHGGGGAEIIQEQELRHVPHQM